MTLKIKFKLAKSIFDYLYIRKLRNSNLNFFTRNRNFIGFFEQLKFFLKKKKNIQIFIIIFKKKKIGYLLIRKRKKKNFLTLVIEEKFRNYGFGKKTIFYAQKKYSNLTSEIFTNNLPSLKIHEKTNFKKKQKRGKKEIWEYNKS